jgi:hypothetical protein
MADSVTADQVVAAARELGQEKFTRGNLLKQLGMSWDEMKPAFREARKSGRLERVDVDEGGKRRFRLTDQSA